MWHIYRKMACNVCMRYICCECCHAMYVWDMYIEACYICMWYIYIDECILACNACMRYVYCKMANVQSETLI